MVCLGGMGVRGGGKEARPLRLCFYMPVESTADSPPLVNLWDCTMVLHRPVFQAALTAAESLASNLAEAKEANESFKREVAAATIALSGDGDMERDVQEVMRIASAVDAKHLSIVANQVTAKCPEPCARAPSFVSCPLQSS